MVPLSVAKYISGPSPATPENECLARVPQPRESSPNVPRKTQISETLYEFTDKHLDHLQV